MKKLVAGQALRLDRSPMGMQPWHVFAEDDANAIEAALASKRPLLLRGEPGVGKSQLARAAAIALGWAYCQQVVDARTQARDLQWTEDLVRRLADAQLAATVSGQREADAYRDRLAIDNYISPGPFWWAFDWDSAHDLASRLQGAIPSQIEGCDPQAGVVVLIDEIDKAETELPNGLLEILGTREFSPPGAIPAISATKWPLVVVTTNQERRLPDAFIRRCIVHDMFLPNDDIALIALLVERGQANFEQTDAAVIEAAARQTVADRNRCKELRLLPLPGQAEFFDLLHAVTSANWRDGEDPLCRIERLAPFVLRKHPDLEA